VINSCFIRDGYAVRQINWPSRYVGSSYQEDRMKTGRHTPEEIIKILAQR